MKKRVDQLLVDLGLCPSRTKAKEMIERRQVRVSKGIGWTVVQQASLMLDTEAETLQILDSDFLKYVSRAGHKLEGALDFLKLDVKNFSCLDVGASTGGFTDCLLQRGAAKITCVDVGTGQLHDKIKNDPRVQNYEGLNAKNLAHESIVANKDYDLIVMDLSFISILKVLDAVLHKAKPNGYLLSLIKPQFEVGSVNIAKGGIVKSTEATESAIQNIKTWANNYSNAKIKIEKVQVFPSQLEGRDGNQEYFLFLTFA